MRSYPDNLTVAGLEGVRHRVHPLCDVYMSSKVKKNHRAGSPTKISEILDIDNAQHLVLDFVIVKSTVGSRHFTTRKGHLLHFSGDLSKGSGNGICST